MLEQVLPHQFRDDIYIDKVITSDEKIKSEDKKIIIKILYDELQSLMFH
ncbi:MAG: hypothetical protein ACTSU4_11635 [Promethearchaeota archaeon]